MSPEELKKIISQGEGTTVEFKSSQEGLARSVYETNCAFLNRCGGHIVLGVTDQGIIIGVNPDKIQEQLDTLAKDLNNPQIIRPTCSFNFETIDIDGKKLIYFYVPEGAEGYCYMGHFYDRNQDGDFELRSTYQIANLFIRKSKSRSEDEVFTQMGIVEELGSGTRKMFKYTPIYAKGQEPIIEEQDIYRVEIPYISTLQAANQKSSEKSGPETTQKTKQKILELIKTNPNIKIEELSSHCEITRDGINYQIRKLKEKES